MLLLSETLREAKYGLKMMKEFNRKTAKFMSLQEHGSTFMTNPCLSTHDAIIKLSHIKVICGRWQHIRRSRFDDAPMKFVYS